MRRDNPTLPLIGLTGRAGSGKDTAASALICSLAYLRIAFADPLKTMLSAGLGLSIQQLEDRTAKESPIDWLDGKTPRQLMQTLGTEWGRTHAHPELWLRIARRKIEIAPGPVVVTDVRFENEASLIRSLGGVICHIERDTQATTAHISEAGVSRHPSDWIITNNGSIEALHQRILTLAQEAA